MALPLRPALRLGLILLAMLLAPLVLPGALHGQQMASGAASSGTVGDEALAAYARAFAAVSRLRDEGHAELAHPRNKTVEAQVEVREGLEAAIATAIQAEGLTGEEYQQITYQVSIDGERRAAFERLVEELPDPGSAPL